jgi:hypothetical protein
MDHDAKQGESLSAPVTAMQHDAETITAAAAPDAGKRLPASAAEMSGEQTSDAAAERLVSDAGDLPTVAHQSWLKEDDYWQRTTYIAITGRHTRVAQPTRPLPRPRRFRRPSPVRSVVVLALTLTLIVLIPLGVVVAQHEAQAHIQLPAGLPSIPGLTEPTHTPRPTITPTVKPTTTPTKHKK